MRRSHKKSRHGCKQCKERHIRCDESRPECLHCRTGNHACSFLPLWKLQLPPCKSPQSSSSMPSSQAKPFPPPTCSLPCDPLPSSPLAGSDGLPCQLFTLQHLGLMHHLESGQFSESLYVGKLNVMYETIIPRALRVPYLMDQLLALSAAHLGVLHPESAAAYQNEAAQLQTRALAALNSYKTDVASHDNLDMFLYSSFLGIHTMFDALRHRDLELLLDAFVTYGAVHRGVLTFTCDSWHEMQPVVNLIVGDRSIFDPVPRGTTQNECAALTDLVNSSPGLTAVQQESCRAVVETLQWAFDMRHIVSNPCAKVHAVTGCATRFPAPFLDLLTQRIPEALVILTYFAVLVHKSRQFWVFGESGQFLINAITIYLGPSWGDYLAWPNDRIYDVFEENCL